MTRTHTSLLLTTLLVVGATTGLTGAVTSSTDTTYQIQDDVAEAAVDSGEVYWQGQFLGFTAGEANASEVWSIRRVQDGAIGDLVTQVLLDGNGSAVIPSRNLDGQFVVVNEEEQPVVFQNGAAQRTGSVTEARFEVTTQQLNATFEAVTVRNDDSPDARTDLRFDSNRAGYQAYLFSDQLSNAQLARIFSAVEVRDDRAVVTRNVAGTDVFDANFTGVEQGTYNVTVVAADGSAQAVASITVSEVVEGTATLSTPTFVEQRGDVARFNVTFDGVDQATVTIGSQQVGYLSRFTVVDENGDGVATVAFDTFRAGLSPDAAGVSVVGEDRLTNFGLLTNPIPDQLDAANYPVTVFVGGRGSDIGVLDLNERSTGQMRVWTAPDREGVGSVSRLSEVATPNTDIAYQDWAIVQVEASGLYSYVQNVSDLNSEQTGLSMTLNRVGEINVPPREVSLDPARLLVDEANNQFFLVVDSNVLESGATYDANFTISPENPYVEAGNATELSARFRVVERTVSIDRPIQVPASGNATITGSSSVAPGTELTIEVTSTADQPFIKRQTVEVSEDETWQAAFDFSDVTTDANFSVSIEDPATTATGVVSGGEAGPAQTTTTTEVQTTTPAEATETTMVETTPAEATETTMVETTPAEETETETTMAATETTTEAEGEMETTVAGASAPAPGFGPVAVVAAAALLLAVGGLTTRRR